MRERHGKPDALAVDECAVTTAEVFDHGSIALDSQRLELAQNPEIVLE